MAIWVYTVNLLVVLFVLTFIFVKRRFSYWCRRAIPHERPSFPGGNIDANSNLPECVRRNYQKYKGTGPFGGFFLNLHPAVVLYDHDLIKNVLVKDFHNFSERGLFHNEQDDPLSGNLFRQDELKWKPLRSQLSPSFSGIKMKDMYLTIVQIGKKLVETFDNIIDPQGSVVEMKEIIARYVADVNGNCIFGLDCNCLNDKNSDFFRTVRSLSSLKVHSKIVSAFMFSFRHLARKLRMRYNHEDSIDFFVRIVRETIEYREKNSIKRNDFLSAMIELMNIEDGLSLEQIAGQTFAYFFAGFENSTACIVFTLYELALNPDIQDKLRAEIVHKINKYRQKISFECMMEMRYLKKVVMESLRKYPIVPILLRLAKNDYQTSEPNYIIPSETLVIIPTEAIQNDPEVYEEPEKFNPERFITDEFEHRNNTAWLPFGLGPRHCIGVRFAKMQIYVALILLLKDYRFHPCEKTVGPVKLNPMKKIIDTKDEIYLRVERV